ncbi:hypothetical protein Tco_0719262 [Tanacetum coccineum]
MQLFTVFLVVLVEAAATLKFALAAFDGRMVERENLSPQQPPQTQDCRYLGAPTFAIQSGVISSTFIFFPSILLEPSMGILGDDDNFLLTMHGLPKPVSWLGSHIKSLIAAMYNENNEGLQQLLELRNYTNNDVLLLHLEDEDVISVAAFVASWITVSKSEDLVVASH